MGLLHKLRQIFFTKNFLQFCLLGTVNTFNTAWMSWLAHHWIQPNLAAVIGYFGSLTIAYFLSGYFIFKSKPNAVGWLRFLISYIPNFLIYILVTFLTINTLRIPQFWATTLAIMAGSPVTFVIIKLYAFKNRDV